MKILPILICPIILFGCAGCNIESEKDLRQYHGDGVARHLKSPGLLGIDGIAIEMPHFDLSKGLVKEYDLSGIPKGGPYHLYLVVPSSSPTDTVFLNSIEKRHCSFTIKMNGVEVSTYSASLKAMINSQYGWWENLDGTNKQWIGFNRFYFDDFGKETKMQIEETSTSKKWTLSVSTTNEFLTEPIDAYILIERGGFK
jgi:hypothetical protein